MASSDHLRALLAGRPLTTPDISAIGPPGLIVPMTDAAALQLIKNGNLLLLSREAVERIAAELEAFELAGREIAALGDEAPSPTIRALA